MEDPLAGVPVGTEPTKPEDVSWADWTLKPGPLSARHRRLAALIALGRTNPEIASELGYVESRVSFLRGSTEIQTEVTRLQDLAFADDLKLRLSGMGHSALDLIEDVLGPNSTRVRPEARLELAKWVAEQEIGKATQKSEITVNVLGSLIDRLDRMKMAQPILETGKSESSGPAFSADLIAEVVVPEPSPDPRTELANWAEDFSTKGPT